MSKVCIITSRNIFDSPCLAKYQLILNNNFDIIFWNRANVEEKQIGNNNFIFQKKINNYDSKIKKIKLYCQFSLFVKNVLKNNKYDKLIIFPTQTAWLLVSNLKKYYLKKYVLDIRDYAGENNFLLKKFTNKSVKYSGFCSITSEKYKVFLPKNFDYYVSHNIQKIPEEIIFKYRTRVKNNNIITISFIGSVRFIEQQKRIIKFFSNDSRFKLNFIGKGSEQLQEFCQVNNYNNVNLIGYFERSKLSDFYEMTDIALNSYGNDNPFIDFALSNKLYSAAMMGMPIIVSPNTYMAEIVEKYNLGFILDLNDINSLNILFEYYVNLDKKSFLNNCDRFMKDVYNDENKYSIALSTFLESE